MFFFPGAKRERDFFFFTKCFLKINEFERLGESAGESLFVCLFLGRAKIAPKMNHVA